MAEPTLTDALAETLRVFQSVGKPGEPLTTQEVTDELDVSRRSTYSRLERLVEEGLLETKKAGARGRVWWQPPAAAARDPPDVDTTVESMLGRLIDNLPGMVYRCRNEQGWPMSYVSRGCAAVSGYDADAIEEGEVSWGEDVIHPKDRERVRDVVQTGLAAEGQFAIQYRVVTPDEETRWVWERGCAVASEGAGGDQLEGVILDITDQIESDRALSQSDEQFRALVDATEEYAIFMLNTDGEVTTWNPGAARIKGYDKSEILGEHFSAFYTETDREANVPDENLAKAVERGMTEDEGWRLRKDGSRFWANVTISAIRDDDGELQGFAKVTRDMTERREYEERLRDERDFTEQILETAPAGIAVVDDAVDVQLANERFWTVLGIADSTPARALDDLTLYDEDDQPVPIAERPHRIALETGDPVENWRCQVDLPTGERRWVSLNARPIAGEDEADRVVLAVQDVTKLVEQTRQLQRERDEIESELHGFFERIDDAFYAVDEQFRFTYVNDRAEELLQHEQAELLGESVWKVFPEARETDAWESFHTAMETQEPTSYQVYFEPLGFWVEASVYPSESGLSVYFRDVTDRVERELSLERYRTVVETMTDGVYVVDEDGRFTMVNDAYLEMTGYDREALLGEHVSTIVDEATMAKARELQAELESGEREQARLETTLQTGDGEIIAEATFGLIENHDGPIERVGVVRDITARKRSEQALEESRQRYRTLIENFPNGAVALVDRDLRYVTVGGTPLTDAGASPSEIEGKHIQDAFPPDVADVLEPRYAAALEGEAVAFEYEQGDRYLRIQIFPVRDETGEVFAAMGMSQDVTELKERERELQDRVRQQEVVTELGKRALEERDIDLLMADAAAMVAETLENDYCKVLDLDQAAEELLVRQGVGWHDGIVGSATVSSVERDSQAAYTLESDAPVVVEDLTTETRFSGPDLLRDHDVRSGISTIIGPKDDPWGILGTHDTTQKPFSDYDVSFVQSVANILGTAIERHRYEQELLWQREQLEALNHLNEVVRDITEAAIEQSTREEIEEVVCAAIADSDSYLFAWTGEVDVNDETVQLRTEAGVEGYLDGITISVDPDDPRSGGPTGRALLTGEMQTTQDIGAEDSHDPWREHVEAHGIESSAAIPLVHEDTVYGVLNVYADRPHAFEGEEGEVIGQLGEIVGHAIAAVERKRALMSDEVVELEFRIADIFEALGIGAAGEGRIEVVDVVPIKDDEYLVYGRATPDAVEGLQAIVDGVPHWEDVTFHGEGDERKFELRLSEPPVLSALASIGGSVDQAVIDDGDYRMTLHVSPSADVRRLIDVVQDAYPQAEMLSRRQVTRERGDDGQLQRVILEDLTDRQRTALRAAYHADFFDWPRKATGEDLADSLDVSPPTFHQHLRKAERKVFESLLADAEQVASAD